MITMHQLWLLSFSLFFLLTFSSILPSLSSSLRSLAGGSSLSVEKPNKVLLSPDATFSAGFHSIGINAYSFAIWFTQAEEFTPVWMANRDYPVNGRGSTLSLQRDGNLILKDGPRSAIWATNTTSDSRVHLFLENTGNLILQTTNGNIILWQSFDSPTNTLLTGQTLTDSTRLVSSRSRTNHSSGFYSLYFDYDNVLRLRFKDRTTSSVYWPDPWLVSMQAGRTSYNNSRIAVLDALGEFHSSDNLKIFASDFGFGPKRRLTMDFDGNVRVYSLDEENGRWSVSWQAISSTCRAHGLCGPNSVCVHTPERRCSCLPGHKAKDPSDFTLGCEPTFNLSCDANAWTFLGLPHADFYGYDFNLTESISLETCKSICLEMCSCKAFMYVIDGHGKCYPKTSLHNGHRELFSAGTLYVKLPNSHIPSDENFVQGMELDCPPWDSQELSRRYQRKRPKGSIKSLFWFTTILGGVELIFIVTGWCYIFKNDDMDEIQRGYLLAAAGFKKFSYSELKKATKNFRKEIGRGAAGVVYKGVLLSEQRAVAVKRLEGVNQGEMEFLGEVSIIGRIYHMNLIQLFGFCAEGEHRLLVYEYMEHGSLADNLASSVLNWEQRFDIAVGTAKGLAYLHEECLEWVLHCDIKPQNILLDGNYNPKVADFGLSKLLDRHGVDRLNFSTVRGTRGYMAPEWIFNLPITSKVDVYSYGIVVLEMVTGKQPAALQEGIGDGRLLDWVRNVMNDGKTSTGTKIEKIKDKRIVGGYDVGKMELLVRVALQCVEEVGDARPTMSRVVEMLLGHGNYLDQHKGHLQEVDLKLS